MIRYFSFWYMIRDRHFLARPWVSDGGEDVRELRPRCLVGAETYRHFEGVRWRVRLGLGGGTVEVIHVGISVRGWWHFHGCRSYGEG